jgi:drug/metabolite transporter (DMT)-like permease
VTEALHASAIAVVMLATLSFLAVGIAWLVEETPKRWELLCLAALIVVGVGVAAGTAP